MTVYHLGRSTYARQLTGEGAKLYGGRWNVIGQPCIYTSEARSLCILEFAANVYLDEIVQDMSFTVYEIPDDGFVSFHLKELPNGWQETPSSMAVMEWGTQQMQRHLALKLPSVIVPSEYNVIINPLHPDFKRVRIKEVESFSFDRRIKK